MSKGLTRLALVSILVVAALLSGCFGRERVMVPPKNDLGGAESIAVIYFENYTDQPNISYDVEEKVAGKLREYYYVAERGEVERALAELGLRRGLVPTRDEILRLGRKLDVDAIVTGEVGFYFEEVVQNPPHIARLYEEGTKAVWEVAQRTKTVVNFTGRVIDARTGNILYTRRAEGESSEFRNTTLSWTSPHEAPSWVLIPSPSKMDIPNVRARAVSHAADQFTADLLPTYQWVKIEE
ncbi:MAG TPA: hypothetical protein GX008_11480 [Firmicutes bacterium]|jgi:hypothetical protein|nr:MAG: hypothetical protein AA931_00365 [Peptococcaceae bacterium 1109]HHT74320.1 hypothetical protein [Bacillota bacterium]